MQINPLVSAGSLLSLAGHLWAWGPLVAPPLPICAHLAASLAAAAAGARDDRLVVELAPNLHVLRPEVGQQHDAPNGRTSIGGQMRFERTGEPNYSD